MEPVEKRAIEVNTGRFLRGAYSIKADGRETAPQEGASAHHVVRAQGLCLGGSLCHDWE